MVGCRRSCAPERHRRHVRGAAERCAARGRRVSAALRGADHSRLVPSHAGYGARGARVPRERCVSLGAARHAPSRAGGPACALRRSAARPAEGRRRSVRTLSLRELNRTLLARQLLAGRRRMPVVRAVGRLVALQAQYAPSPYVALWSRLDGFRKEQLTRALVDGTVVKAGALRTTLHVMAGSEFPYL